MKDFPGQPCNLTPTKRCRLPLGERLDASAVRGGQATEWVRGSSDGKEEEVRANPSSQEPAPQAPKKPTILGTDHALTMPTAQGTSLDLSYWDLWFSIVAVLMHDGDLDRLANRIKEEKGFFYDRRSLSGSGGTSVT